MSLTNQLALPAILVGALAASAVPVSAVANNATTEQTIGFDIKPGTLEDVLNGFGVQAGIVLVFSPELTKGLESSGLTGQYNVQQALQELLQGTDIVPAIEGNTITLGRAEDDAVMVFDPMIVITGSIDDSAYGPVDGYIAKRSGTGTKTDAALIETPQSVSVISRDQMSRLNLETPSQALRYTSGVVAELFGNDPRFDWVSIRGFATDEYLDGMALPKGNYSWPRHELYGVERAEVLKGPASVLYGSSSSGGLYNFVSKRPSKENQGEVRLQTGDPDRIQISGDVTGQVPGTETFQYRLTGLWRDADTLVDHVENDRTYLQPSFSWTPSDKTTFTVLGYHTEDDSKSLQFLPAEGVLKGNINGKLDRSTFTGEPDYDKFEREQKGIGYLLEHEFAGGWTLNHKLRKSEVDVELKGIRPSFGWVDANFDGQPDDYRTHNRVVFLFEDNAEALTSDTNIAQTFNIAGMDHSVLLGFDYRKMNTESKLYYALTTPLDLYDPTYGLVTQQDPPLFSSNEQELKQQGFYLQDQIKWDQTTFLMSVRSDRSTIDNDSEAVFPPSSSSESVKDDKISYRTGLLHNFDNGFAPYLSYATSFEPNLGVDEDGKSFDPTLGKQLEFGVKYQSPDNRQLVTLSFFKLVQSDVVMSSLTPGAPKEQVGEITSKGVELEVKAKLLDNLNLISALTYTDAEISKDTNRQVEGNQVASVPERQASVWLDYQFADTALQGFGLGSGIRYVGDHYGDKENDIRVPSYTLVDFLAYYDFSHLGSYYEGFQVSTNVSNVTDKEFVAHCDDAGSCYWGEGRVITAAIDYRW